MTLVIAFFMLCGFVTSPLHAQSGRDATISKIGAELLVLIEENIEGRQAIGVGNDLIQLDALYNYTDPKFQLAGRQEMKNSQASQIAKDIGLNFKTQYFVNYDPSVNDPETTDDDGVGNRSRFGLEWELLRGGLVANQRKAKELRLQEELAALNYDLKKNDERLFLRYNIIIYLFNEAKIKLLEESLEQVLKEIELLYQVYFLKGILFEEILKAKSRLDQMKVQLENYQTYNRIIAQTLDVARLKERFNYHDLPVLDINLDYLVEDQTGMQLLDSLNNLEKRIQNSRNRAIDDVSLKLHAYQYLGSSNNFDLKDRASVSAGISLTLPTEIIFDGRARKRVADERIRERVKFENYEHVNEKTEIINYYYEYNYKLKTFMEYVYKDMLYQERVRIETVNHKDFSDIHRSLKILRDMDAMRSIRLETVDLKQQMYLLLLKIYGNTHYRSILPAVSPIDVAAFYQRLPAKRSIVMGHKILKEYSERFVVHYLLSNGIEKLIVEPGQTLSVEMKNLLAENKIEIVSAAEGRQMTQSADGIAWHIDYALEDNGYNGVQLDFTDSSTPEETQQFILNNIDRIQKSEDNISIQIGKGFPAEFMSTLLRITDRLTIKMEKPSDLDYLRKLANLSEEKGKFGISLKAKSFKDRMELEAYIDMVHSVYGVQHVIIDDLDQYMSLDTKTLANME